MSILRIMIADDHEVVRRGLRSLVEAQPGWQVVGEATDGRDVVKHRCFGGLVLYSSRKFESLV